MSIYCMTCKFFSAIMNGTINLKKSCFLVVAFETITNVKKDILMKTGKVYFPEEEIVQQKKEILISILSSAIPLNGNGYFQVKNSIVTSIIGAATTYIVVLVQFKISENSLDFKTLQDCNLNQSTIFETL